MKRLVLPAAALAILAIGILVGMNGRSVMDSAQGVVRGSVASAPTATVGGRVIAAAAAQPISAPTSTPAPKPTATPAPPRDLVIEVTETDLTEQLQLLLVGQPLGATPIGDATIRSVWVTLRDGQMQVGGGASVGPLSAPFVVAGTITPDAAGRPSVTLTSAQVSGFAIPDAIRAGLGELLQQQIDQLFAQGTMRIRTVEIADGRMRITASP